MEKGYKNTEIGVIPEEWEVKLIFDIANIIGGGTPSTNNTVFWNGKINWFTPTEIGKTKYVNKSIRRISEEGLKNSSARLLPKGTILLTSRAGIGDLAILKKESSTNQGFQSLIVKDSVLNEFLYYLLSTYKSKLLEKASGSTFLEISPNNLKQIQIPLPPLPEQTAIATVLSDTDSLIQILEKKIAKKQLIKKGAMQTLLSPKEGWEVKKIKEFSLINTGAKNTENKIEDGKYAFFVRSPKIERINTFTFEGEAVLVAGDGVGTGKVMHYFCGKFDYHQRVYKISDFDKTIIGYYFFLFFKMNFHKRIMQMTAKSSVDSVRLEMISEMEIHYPPLSEQNHIAQILSDMDNEIEILEKKLTKYKQLKQGLMQNLLTGKIRLV